MKKIILIVSVYVLAQVYSEPSDDDLVNTYLKKVFDYKPGKEFFNEKINEISDSEDFLSLRLRALKFKKEDIDIETLQQFYIKYKQDLWNQDKQGSSLRDLLTMVTTAKSVGLLDKMKEDIFLFKNHENLSKRRAFPDGDLQSYTNTHTAFGSYLKAVVDIKGFSALESIYKDLVKAKREDMIHILFGSFSDKESQLEFASICMKLYGNSFKLKDVEFAKKIRVIVESESAWLGTEFFKYVENLVKE